MTEMGTIVPDAATWVKPISFNLALRVFFLLVSKNISDFEYMNCTINFKVINLIN